MGLGVAGCKAEEGARGALSCCFSSTDSACARAARAAKMRGPVWSCGSAEKAESLERRRQVGCLS